MSENIGERYTPLLFWWFLYITSGSLLIIISIVLTIVMIYGSIWLPLKFFIFFIVIASIGFGINFVLYPFIAKIAINERGIFYKQPLYTITSAWEDIQGIEATDIVLLLCFSQSAVISKRIFRRIPYGKTFTIPLHLFVSNWNKKEVWSKNSLLTELQKHLPSTVDAVTK